MQIKISYSRGLLGFCLLFLIAACTQQWFFSVEAGKDRIPIFCFSSKANCNGEAVQFATVVISEVDPAGNTVGIVWAVQGASSVTEHYQLNRLVYGVVPPGWKENVAPQSLRAGTFYTAMDNFYFSFDSAGKFRVWPREQFFSEVAKK